MLNASLAMTLPTTPRMSDSPVGRARRIPEWWVARREASRHARKTTTARVPSCVFDLDLPAASERTCANLHDRAPRGSASLRTHEPNSPTVPPAGHVTKRQTAEHNEDDVVSFMTFDGELTDQTAVCRSPSGRGRTRLAPMDEVTTGSRFSPPPASPAKRPCHQPSALLLSPMMMGRLPSGIDF